MVKKRRKEAQWLLVGMVLGFLGCAGTVTPPTPPVLVIKPVPAACLQYVLPAVMQGWKTYGDCASGTNVPGCIQDIVQVTVTLALQYSECKDVVTIGGTLVQPSIGKP